MSYGDLQFQWYNKGIKNIRPTGMISLSQFKDSIISPKPHMVKAFKEIEEAAEKGDLKLKDELKSKNLFFTTPSCIVNPIRNYDSIIEFRPFIVLEYDKVQYGEELRDYIFEKQKSCILAFLSPSKTGCKFIFHSELPKSIQHYKELFFGIAHELDKFVGLDLSNERCTQPLFNSYDPNALYRDDAVASCVRGYKTNSFVPFEGELEVKENVTEKDREECFSMVAHLIDRIEDNGHNQVISSSFVAGGVCSYYSISEDDMWNHLENHIRINDYLSKGTIGYLKSARTMFTKGLDNPVPLKKDQEND